MVNDNYNPKNKKAQETADGNVPAGNTSPTQSPELFYSPDSEMERGWIKSWRKFLDWEWFKKPGMFRLFHCLIYNANHKDGKWQGVEIKRGQLVSGRNSLSRQTGLSPQQIRTCLKRLENTGELTIESTKQYSIITICNYEKYQPSEKEINQDINHQSTKHQPTINHKQELKKGKNEKNNIYPDWLNMDLWKEFKEHRIKLKAPMSSAAEKRNILKLEKVMSDNGASQDDIIGQSIEFGWKGLFPIRGAKQNGKQTDGKLDAEYLFGDLGPPERS